MRLRPLAVVFALTMGGAACAMRAPMPVSTAAPTPEPEPDLPVLAQPPAPPRIVAIYIEPEELTPVEPPAAAEPSSPSRPAPRPPAATPQPETPAAPPPPLTLTPVPGTEAKTEASIRSLLGRVSRDLGRVNASGLSIDGRTQYEAAQRFVQQAEDALKVRNLVYAGKLADKAAAMAAVLAR